MESSSFEDVNRLVRSELYEHMDPEFGKYLAMNLPGCGNIIGVRLDDLKEIDSRHKLEGVSEACAG